MFSRGSSITGPETRRRPRPLTLIFVASLCFIAGTARAQQSFDRATWASAADTLRAVEAGKRISLGAPFIRPGSEVVRTAGAALDPSQYRINYQLGTIRIDVDLPDDAVVVVSYERLPFLLSSVYSLRPITVAEAARDTVAPPDRSPPAPPPEPARNLVFGGSKSVSFTIGSNRGTSLDQALNANIEGQLTPDIKVRALLSDNNLPIQPEGNTEELEYLDKVFIEIEGRRARATLGDFTFANDVSTFSPLRRQMKGISTEAWTVGDRVAVAGATSKGVFRTVKFRGTTGLQGPYELLSAGRNTGEVIIAGTERVYVDGIEMARGQNRDYVIDYDQGTITFTPKILVTKDSEIAVDFEVSQERYDRTALLGAVKTNRIPGGVSFEAVFARERDDKDRPRNVVLSDEDRRVLGEAGDDADAALTGGVTPAEPGEGLYVRVPADTIAGTPEFFVFDDSTGTFNVSFVEVGVGRGDYTLAGISTRGLPFYEFVGAGNGNYTVGKQLPLPESLRLVTARLRRSDGAHFRFDTEWNVSEFDRNLFSSLDDGDNTGDAGRVSAELRDLGVGLGTVGLSASLSTIEERFKSFDKIRSSYFYRDWNLEDDRLEGREILQEYGLEFKREEAARFGYSLGRIERDGIDGTKHESNALITGGPDRRVSARVFRTETNGAGEERTRRHGTVTAGYGFWQLAPSATYTNERFLKNTVAPRDSGRAYELVGLRLARRPVGRVSASVSVEQRDTEEITADRNRWEATRRDETLTAAVGVRGWGPVYGEMQVTHRVEEDLLRGGSSTTDLARLKGTVRAVRIGLRSDIDYEISQNQTRTLERSVVFVGKGQGDYNEQGEAVGKGLGDFALVFLPTTETVPTRRVELNLRMQWKGRGDGAGTGFFDWVRANVSLDQTIRVREETDYDPAWKVYLMLPSALQRNEATLSGVTSLRQDWSFLNAQKNVSLTLKYKREDEEENRFEGVKENRFFGEHALRLSRSVSALLTLTAEMSREVRRRDGQGVAVGTGSGYDVETWSGLGGVGLRFSTGSNLDLDLEFADRSDAESGARQASLSFQPRLLVRFTDTISLFGSYDLTRVWDREETLVRPVFFTAEGNAHRWNVTPNVRVSKTISVVAAYQGRSETTFTGDRVTEHELRLETRAYF